MSSPAQGDTTAHHGAHDPGQLIISKVPGGKVRAGKTLAVHADAFIDGNGEIDYKKLYVRQGGRKVLTGVARGNLEVGAYEVTTKVRSRTWREVNTPTSFPTGTVIPGTDNNLELGYCEFKSVTGDDQNGTFTMACFVSATSSADRNDEIIYREPIVTGSYMPAEFAAGAVEAYYQGVYLAGAQSPQDFVGQVTGSDTITLEAALTGHDYVRRYSPWSVTSLKQKLFVTQKAPEPTCATYADFKKVDASGAGDTEAEVRRTLHSSGKRYYFSDSGGEIYEDYEYRPCNEDNQIFVDFVNGHASDKSFVQYTPS